MNCEECKNKFWEYITDEINDIDKKQVIEHLKECDECKKDLQNSKLIISDLQEIKEIEVPDDFHASLMNRLSKESVEINLPSKANLLNKGKQMRMAIVASVAMVAVGIVANSDDSMDIEKNATVITAGGNGDGFASNTPTLTNESVTIDMSNSSINGNDMVIESGNNEMETGDNTGMMPMSRSMPEPYSSENDDTINEEIQAGGASSNMPKSFANKDGLDSVIDEPSTIPDPVFMNETPIASYPTNSNSEVMTALDDMGSLSKTNIISSTLEESGENAPVVDIPMAMSVEDSVAGMPEFGGLAGEGRPSDYILSVPVKTGELKETVDSYVDAIDNYSGVNPVVQTIYGDKIVVNVSTQDYSSVLGIINNMNKNTQTIINNSDNNEYSNLFIEILFDEK